MVLFTVSGGLEQWLAVGGHGTVRKRLLGILKLALRLPSILAHACPPGCVCFWLSVGEQGMRELGPSIYPFRDYIGYLIPHSLPTVSWRFRGFGVLRIQGVTVWRARAPRAPRALRRGPVGLLFLPLVSREWGNEVPHIIP